jgi:hypothetical protein
MMKKIILLFITSSLVTAGQSSSTNKFDAPKQISPYTIHLRGYHLESDNYQNIPKIYKVLKLEQPDEDNAIVTFRDYPHTPFHYSKNIYDASLYDLIEEK